MKKSSSPPKAINSGYKISWDELIKGHDRIGSTSHQCMEWLIRLGKTDLAELSKGDWSNLQMELIAILEFGFPAKGGASQLSRPLEEADEMGPIQSRFKNSRLDPTKEQVERLQHLINSHLEELAGQRYTEFPGITLSLVVQSRWTFKPGTFVIFPTGGYASADAINFEHRFIYYMAHLIAPHATNLRRCAECKDIFCKERKNRQYCSTKCLSRVTTRANRQRAKPTRKTPLPTNKGGKHGKK